MCVGTVLICCVFGYHGACKPKIPYLPQVSSVHNAEFYYITRFKRSSSNGSMGYSTVLFTTAVLLSMASVSGK